MEHWKRRQMRLNYEWDLTGFEDEEVSRDLYVALPKLTNSKFEEFQRQQKTLFIYLFRSSFIFQIEIDFSLQFDKLQLNEMSIGY